MKFSKLSILMPVFNEQYTLEEILNEVQAVKLPGGLEKEIIIVDDCSRDGTRKILARIETEQANVRVFYQERNGGKGSSIRRAIEVATGDLIVIQDADMEYDPRDIPRLLEPILDGDADIVYGSRFAGTSRRRVLMFWHTVGNKALTMLCNMFSNLNLTDMETCYKAGKAAIWKSIPIRCNRFGIEPEVTIKFSKRGCRMYEVPISYRGRSYAEGKKITWWDGVKALGVILYFSIVDDVYNEQYGHDILHSLSKTHRFNRWMADTINPWTRENILEIGSGMGNLTRQFLPRKSYTASDIDSLHLDYLNVTYSDHKHVSVKKINVEESSDFHGLEGKFDTVVCLNVIEHVERDRDALKNIFSALQPGGNACILVPRDQRLYGTLDTVLGHFRRYSEEELRAKFVEAGFEVVTIFTFNKMAVPAWWWNGRVLKRSHFGKVQLKIFDSLVWLWRRIEWLLPWSGISLIAIGRRPDPKGTSSTPSA